ncbi:MAG: TIGR03621 family F420-dependent LLM class oxidoreductase [Chloroflexi bacterium]|nr:TIGR03621 family F420-dependent LLM class oxidoreductase [Chloroflexota bacterium]
MPPVRRFRFGVIHEQPQDAPGWRSHLRRIEDLGFSTFLVRDHLVADFFGEQPAPLVALASAAALTTRLRLGTMVLAVDYRHPAMLAKEVASLDLLSGGRLELGLGAGWLRREYEAAGLPFDPAGTRIDRLEEAITILDGLFRDGPLTFGGKHYTVTELEGYPKPVQRPRPPLLIGGGRRRVLTLAGRVADIVGILTTSVASGTVVDDASERLADAVARKLAWVREGAGARYPDIELSLIPTLLFEEDRERAAADLIAARGWREVTPADVLAMPSVFIGSVGAIVDQMEERRARYGFSYYVVSDRQLDQAAVLVARLAAR